MALHHDILRQYWGYDYFRPKQEEIIQSILQKQDTIALLPTGGGKSICFQVPAMCMQGLCLVVSPLMALMHDQVNNLRKRKINAHAVTSAMSHYEMDRVLDNCIYGDVKFLYVSPERLKNEFFLERFKKMKLSLIAIDEAHCISQWGYDFRPAYLKIADIREIHKGVPILALTASATPVVVADIQDKLKFPEHNLISSSFDRPNLSYNVSEQENKEGKLVEICQKMKGSGIVYCGTRLRTRQMAELLKRNGISSEVYNAGMSVKERDLSFRKWMTNEVRIMCATNAFGMGIDKPDVRFVLHADLPGQPEAYFQEAGRAGRDGQKAYAVLLFHVSDIDKMQKQIDQKFPDRDFVRKVYKNIGNFLQLAPGAGMDISYPFDVLTFCRNFDLNYTETVNALNLLSLAGYVNLNEVAFLPSKVIFKMNRQDLYSYQVVNPAMDNLIKVILRMYGGLFEQYAGIREDDIAKNARMSRNEVIDKLRILHNQGVLDYVPKSDTPLLTFLTGRMHEDNIRLEPVVYENRKRGEIERLHVMERYLTKKRCRSIQLLEYFGEKFSDACGHCDVCRENKKHGLEPEEFEEIGKSIFDLILKKEFTVDELPQLLPAFEAAHLIEYVRWKMDTGELILTDKLIIALPGLENE